VVEFRQSNLTPEVSMVMHFYGPVIDDALSNRKASLDDLRILRHHASAVLEAQGDLKKKLKTLDQEIKRRETTEKSR
jgi:hypothetical protein